MDHLCHNQERAGKNFLHCQIRNHYAGVNNSVGKRGLAAKHDDDLSSILGTRMMKKRTNTCKLSSEPHNVYHDICKFIYTHKKYINVINLKILLILTVPKPQDS